MAYENYKELKDMDAYFSSWADQNQVKELSQKMKQDIYNKYVVKCQVFERDNFTCQNETCPYCENLLEHDKLTMHHVKLQKNGGKDKVRNCVTLCFNAHKNFHRAKDSVTFWGQTFKSHKDNKTNWKKITKENKAFRKELMQNCPDLKGFEELPLERILALLRFLFVEYKNLDEDNYDDDY